ncbi:hypothetical protein [Caldisericum sp.]|uniref:hypothetical protein n=1 Tax=Caldisericum sp. TaxID=2499687 RepID=UPI003D15141E
MVKVVNLTPHAVKIEGYGEIPASGQVARVAEVVVSEKLVEGLKILEKRFGQVLNLPEPQPGVFYFVSLAVAQIAHRPDVVSGADYVRDEKGNIVGVKSLQYFS